MNAVRIDFACNDHRDGSFRGCFEGVNIHGLVELELVKAGEPSIRVQPGRVWVSGLEYACVASKEWFGNWSWNAYWFPPETAFRLLDRLHATGKFAATLSTEPLLDWWDNALLRKSDLFRAAEEPAR
jgi:hypothetical protein